MLRILTLFFVSSISTFGVFGDSTAAKKGLEKELEETNEAIKTTAKEVERLDVEINEVMSQCADKLTIGRLVTHNANDKLRKMVEYITHVWRQLEQTRAERVALSSSCKNNRKLRLGIAVMIADMKTYQSRRKDGIEGECFDLENVDRKERFLKEGEIKDTIVAEDELRLARSNLEQLRRRKEEKKLKKRLERKLCENQQRNFFCAVQRLKKDIAKARREIFVLETELMKQQNIVKRLKCLVAQTRRELEKTKEEAKRVLYELQKYDKARLCYSALHNDVITVVKKKI